MSDDLKNNVEKIANQIADLQKERSDLEKEAVAFETSARANRKRMAEIKEECRELSLVLGHKQVAKRVEDNESKTKQTLAEVEATLKRLQAKESQLDEKLAAVNTEE